MDVERYLKRIHIDRIEALGLEFLSKLQLNHLLSVPFENLDITAGRRIILDEDKIYEKIVLRNRGGFCYELNALFARLLRSLGFRLDMVSGRVYNLKRERFGPQFDHMALLVHLDRPYVVDVGYGNSTRVPLAMPDGTVEDAGGVFRIRAIGPGRERYFIEKKDNSVWICQYAFRAIPRELPDFEAMCLYHQTSPDSIFSRGPFCSIATPSGRLTLFMDKLYITEHGVQRMEPVLSEEYKEHLLRDRFGIRE